MRVGPLPRNHAKLIKRQDLDIDTHRVLRESVGLAKIQSHEQRRVCPLSVFVLHLDLSVPL